MKILFCGPPCPAITDFLRQQHHARIEETTDILPLDAGLHHDFLISYRYSHIIPASLLHPFGQRAINLHISYLPWNRGADPNLWSFLESTPKGVSIHQMTPGVDAGPLYTQARLDFHPSSTLRETYSLLSSAIEQLFQAVWPALSQEKLNPIPQPDGGSFHRKKDKSPYEHLLVSGWDTPVGLLNGAALPAPNP